MTATPVQRRRNTVALLSRHHPNSTELIEARRALAAEKLAAYIKRTIDTAPPLSEDQRSRLTALLLTAAIGGGSDGSS